MTVTCRMLVDRAYWGIRPDGCDVKTVLTDKNNEADTNWMESWIPKQ